VSSRFTCARRKRKPVPRAATRCSLRKTKQIAAAAALTKRRERCIGSAKLPKRSGIAAALAIHEARLGAEHPATRGAEQMASANESQGHACRRRRLIARCWRIRQRVLGAEHTDTLARRNKCAATVHARANSPERGGVSAWYGRFGSASWGKNIPCREELRKSCTTWDDLKKTQEALAFAGCAGDSGEGVGWRTS